MDTENILSVFIYLSSLSGLLADKTTEIDQPDGLIFLFLTIKKVAAVCASLLLISSAGRITHLVVKYFLIFFKFQGIEIISFSLYSNIYYPYLSFLVFFF